MDQNFALLAIAASRLHHRIRTLLAVFDSFIGTHDSVCGRSPTPVQASRRPLGPQRHSSRLQLHVPRLRQAPRCRTSPVREVRRTFWLTASPRSPRACLAPGARQQLKASLDAGVRGFGISPARARTTDESARAGPTTSRRMNPAILQAPAMLTAATRRRRAYRSSRLHNLTAAASSSPYARRPHAPLWKPPNISGRLIAANLRKQSISLLSVPHPPRPVERDYPCRIRRKRLCRTSRTRSRYKADIWRQSIDIQHALSGNAQLARDQGQNTMHQLSLARDSPFDDPDTIRAERRQASAQAAHNSRLRVMNETA
ncbi:UNVERIFIED_ORG: hypothetical protein ABIC48_005812 [Burkholderia territorii]